MTTYNVATTYYQTPGFFEAYALGAGFTANTINGRDHVGSVNGNDTIIAGGQADTINGNGGNDYLFGTAGADSINGGIGNDILDGGNGNNTLSGGTGYDTYIMNFTSNDVGATRIIDPDKNGVIFIGEAPYDPNASSSAIALQGYQLKGDATAVSGQPGVYQLELSGHTYQLSWSGNINNPTSTGNLVIKDILNTDSTLRDIITYTIQDFQNGRYDISLGAHVANGGTNINDDPNPAPSTGGGTTPSVPTAPTPIGGNNQANPLNGTAGADIILGYQGDDTLMGMDGNDSIRGGRDNDFINGNQGNDSVFGDLGNDTGRGGQGDDIAHGGQGDDRLYGDFASDHIYGEFGNDDLHGGQGNDTLEGGEGGDFLTGDRGNDILIGGAASDVFVFDDNAGNDTITDFTSVDMVDTLAVASVDTYDEFRAAAHQQGADIIVTLGTDSTLTIQNYQLSNFTTDNFGLRID